MRDYKYYEYHLTKKDIQNLVCFFYKESNSGLLTAVFLNFPLILKQHCFHVGEVGKQIAKYAPRAAIPEGMDREGYMSAVRYGCLYHHIGAYLVYNQIKLYPTAGERFLREQLNKEKFDPKARKVILETVQFYKERYDGQGYPNQLKGDAIPFHAEIGAIADKIDHIISNRNGTFTNRIMEANQFVYKNNGKAFSPAAVNAFTAASSDVFGLYKYWNSKAPF